MLYKVIEISRLKDFKTYFNIFSSRLLGILIPIFCLSIYLTHFDIWYVFFDYTIFGIKTFTNYVPYSRLFYAIDRYKTLAYIIPSCMAIIAMTCIVTFIKKDWRKKEWTKNLYILFAYSLASAVIIYPIADKTHFAIASICTLIIIAYLIYLLITKILNKRKEKTIFVLQTFIESFAILIISGYTVFSLSKDIDYIRTIKNQHYLEHFKYITTSELI